MDGARTLINAHRGTCGVTPWKRKRRGRVMSDLCGLHGCEVIFQYELLIRFAFGAGNIEASPHLSLLVLSNTTEPL